MTECTNRKSQQRYFGIVIINPTVGYKKTHWMNKDNVILILIKASLDTAASLNLKLSH